MVKYYFYKGMVPKDQHRLRSLIALAYQTARDRKLYPKAVLIRYEAVLKSGITIAICLNFRTYKYASSNNCTGPKFTTRLASMGYTKRTP